MRVFFKITRTKILHILFHLLKYVRDVELCHMIIIIRMLKEFSFLFEFLNVLRKNTNPHALLRYEPYIC